MAVEEAAPGDGFVGHKPVWRDLPVVEPVRVLDGAIPSGIVDGRPIYRDRLGNWWVRDLDGTFLIIDDPVSFVYAR